MSWNWPICIPYLRHSFISGNFSLIVDSNINFVPLFFLLQGLQLLIHWLLFVCTLHQSLSLWPSCLFSFLAFYAFIQCSLINVQLNLVSLEYLIISSLRWFCLYSSNSFLSSFNSCFLPSCFVLFLVYFCSEFCNLIWGFFFLSCLEVLLKGICSFWNVL